MTVVIYAKNGDRLERVDLYVGDHIWPSHVSPYVPLVVSETIFYINGRTVDRETFETRAREELRD